MPLLDEQIVTNRRRSKLLFAGFFLIYAFLAIAISLAFSGWPASNNYVILIVFALTAGFIVLVTFKMGDDMAVMLAKARQINERSQCPPLWDATETMAIAAGRVMPRLYLSPDRSANAFAAGRKPEDAVLCVNQGLLDLLDKNELEAVVAHEMSHIRNLDIRLMTYAAVLAGGIVLISEALLRVMLFSSDEDNGPAALAGIALTLFAAIVAPIAALIIQMSISRNREYLADASAVELTKFPEALSSALRQISAEPMRAQTGSKATAHLYFTAPLFGSKSPSRLFATHPPIEERIARLDKMAGGQAYQRQKSRATPSAEALPEEDKASAEIINKPPELEASPLNKWPIILLVALALISAALLLFSF